MQAKVCRRFLTLLIRGRCVDGALLVAHLVIAEVGVLDERFTHAGHTAVAEDAEASGEERRLDAIALDVLVLKETNEGLRHG